MAIASPINLDKVSSGIKSLNTGMGQLKKSANNIKTVLLNKTKIKRESIARNKMLSTMREEAVKRKDQESIIESSGISGAFKRSGKVIGDSTKGFLGRLLDFTSSLLLGWLLYNLPTIMTAIEDLITRIRNLYGILTDFMGNIRNTFINFGQLLSAVYLDITQFDFTDQSKRVQNAMNDLSANMDSMHDEFMRGFQLLTTPLGQGPGEEPVPELNTDYTQPGPTTGGGQDLYTLATIANLESGSAQGQADVAQSIYNRIKKGGKGVVDVTTSPGQYEPFFGKGGGIDPESKNIKTFDDAVKYRMKKTGENRATAERSVLSTISAIQDPSKQTSAREFIGTRTSFRGSPQNTGNTLRNVAWRGSRSDNQFLNEENVAGTPGTVPSFVSSPTRPTQPSSPIPTAQVKSKPMVITSGFGWRWGRQHQGIDLVTKTGKVEGTPVVIKKGGTIVYANIGGGNMGQVLITHDDGTQSRYLHVNSFQVRAGQKVNAGQTIANLAAMGASGIGNAKGPHLHFEYYSSTRAGPSDPAGVYKNYVSLGGGGVPTSNPLDPNQQSRTASAQVSPPKPSAQVTPPKPPGQNVPSVAQDRKGQQIIIADNPQQPQPQQVLVGGGSQPQMIPTESSLNSLIKNQILLELAYT